MTTHNYEVTVAWTGNRGEGTASYRAFSRDHEVAAAGKSPIAASSDPAFRGDPGRYNPEEMLVASLSQCHMLWYLHLCSVNGVVVTDYVDSPLGTLTESGDGGGHFTEVVLRPRIVVTSEEMTDRAGSLHEPAHQKCFISNSVNFPVRCEPEISVAD